MTRHVLIFVFGLFIFCGPAFADPGNIPGVFDAAVNVPFRSLADGPAAGDAPVFAHSFSSDQCADCHAVPPVAGNRASIVLTAPVSRLCSRCHDVQQGLSHLVDMAPSAVPIPPDFPLSAEGTLTCCTCHAVHGNSAWGTGPAGRFLLRAGAAPSFCENCHRQDGHTAGSHGAILGRAHVKIAQDLSRPSKRGIDHITSRCLACHDGGIGETASVRFSGRHTALMSSSASDSHTVGVSYRFAVRKHADLRPAESLPGSMKFVNGKLGCCSCHNPYAQSPKKLVLSNAGSRLCLACHAK